MDQRPTTDRVDFYNEPRFVELDNRKNREHSRVTAESLNKRHAAALPRSEVEGKTILDLGSAIGATGYWCLENGAKHYTGVEVQPLYCERSREILNSLYADDQFSIVESSIENFLETCTDQYDVVILSGVLYAFIDTVTILKQAARVAKETVVIDSAYPREIRNVRGSFISITKNQHINSSLGNFSYVGLGARPSPEALRLIMGNFGFEFTGLRLPEKMDAGLHDAYNETIAFLDFKFPLRFIASFKKEAAANVYDTYRTASENTQNESINRETFDTVSHRIYPQKHNPVLSSRSAVSHQIYPQKRDSVLSSWSFENKETIDNFQQIAEKNIPNYERVINKCLYIANRRFPDKNARIVDIGSSRGHTLERFYEAGYRNIFGVDNSKGMLENSFKNATLIHSETFPRQLTNMDMVIANWVLHFVKERKEYLQKIYDALNEGGVFVVSDKMVSPDDIHEMYHDFKRRNGLTEKQIEDKEKAIVGILVPYPLEWYLQLLEQIGFTDISVIDADFSFSTIYCTKRDQVA